MSMKCLCECSIVYQWVFEIYSFLVILNLDPSEPRFESCLMMPFNNKLYHFWFFEQNQINYDIQRQRSINDIRIYELPSVLIICFHSKNISFWVHRRVRWCNFQKMNRFIYQMVWNRKFNKLHSVYHSFCEICKNSVKLI